MKKLLAVLAVSLALPNIGLAASYDESVEAWEGFVFYNKFGDAQDYWLEKNTSVGWAKLLIVMGYGSDMRSCNIIKSLLEAKYTAAQYRCKPANN